MAQHVIAHNQNLSCTMIPFSYYRSSKLDNEKEERQALKSQMKAGKDSKGNANQVARKEQKRMNPILAIFADPRTPQRIQKEGGDVRPMGLTKSEFFGLI